MLSHTSVPGQCPKVWCPEARWHKVAQDILCANRRAKTCLKRSTGSLRRRASYDGYLPNALPQAKQTHRNSRTQQ
eukprot:scaffold113673_cov69-Phaeocystis_antarctica.AAC.3